MESPPLTPRPEPAKPVLYFLTGPTAVGKTALSLQWARDLNAEIVSCDAVQFYRGLDIGSAKPDPRERKNIPHHLLDIRDPSEPLSLGDYQNEVRKVISDLHARRKNALITGGSGFYLSSFFYPLTSAPSPSPEIRKKVRQCEKEKGLTGLLQWLHQLDPQAESFVDQQNPVRVARAIERCLSTGKSLARQKSEQENTPCGWESFDRRLRILSRPRAELHQRIAERVDQMISAGLEQEVAQLIPRGIEKNPSASRAIGYRETISLLRGEYTDRQTWRQDIITSTRRLVRKQEIWFRRFFPEAWEKRIDLSRIPHPAIDFAD